jgi:Ca2+-binding EF-hand superfamily protein
MNRCVIATLAMLTLGTSSALADGDRADRWFDRLDTNKDGVISQAEVNARQADRFAKIDANGDGMISPEEYNARTEAHFIQADADGNGEVTKDEFTAALSQWRDKHKDAE